MDGQSYTVKEGDTLSKVASQYGVNISDISGYSSGNPDVIRPGENLTVKTRTQAPANTVNAKDLNTKQYQVPPVQPVTGFDGLIKSSEAAIINLGGAVDTGKENIEAKYDRLGQLPTERTDGYKDEGVYDKQAAYSKAVNTINQKELAYQTKVDKIRNNNPTGQLEDGQQIQIDKLTKDWAITKAAMSISAAFLKDDYELAKTIVDDRVDAETEALTNELAGLEFFYSQNYNELSDERKNLLEFQMNQIAEEKADTTQRLQEIGAIQLAAAENGAPSSVVTAIGKSTDLTGAITAAGSWIDQTINRGGSGSGFGSNGNGTVDLAPEDERILTGAGFSTQEISDLQRAVADFGIDAVLSSSEFSVSQKNAIKKVYNVGDALKTRADAEAEVASKGVDLVLKTVYDTAALKKLADEAGSSKWYRGKTKDVNAYLKTDAAKQKAIELYIQKYQKDGIYGE